MTATCRMLDTVAHRDHIRHVTDRCTGQALSEDLPLCWRHVAQILDGASALPGITISYPDRRAA